MARHRLTKGDLSKRRGDRRLLALELLAKTDAAHRKAVRSAATGRRVNIPVPFRRPVELARLWKLHPSSTYRVLERLRKYGSVKRRGAGIRAEYMITDAGRRKMAFLRARFGA